MSRIDVLTDAAVVLKWFHDEGEEDVAAARALLDLHARHHIMLHVLDVTPCEIAEALLGRGRVDAGSVRTVLDAVATICPQITPTRAEAGGAVDLAQQHRLRFADALYAAVAGGRGARLATMSPRLLRAGLGQRPGELASQLGAPRG